MALYQFTPVLVRTAGAAWLAFSVPHLFYHLHHLHGLPPVDQVALMGSVIMIVVLPLLLVLPDRGHAG